MAARIEIFMTSHVAFKSFRPDSSLLKERTIYHVSIMVCSLNFIQPPRFPLCNSSEQREGTAAGSVSIGVSAKRTSTMSLSSATENKLWWYPQQQKHNPYATFDCMSAVFFAQWFCPCGQSYHQKVFKTITWLLLTRLQSNKPHRNSPEPSEPCVRYLHQRTPELSGTCLRNLQ